MAIVQRTDLNLNNQKRFAEGAVATFPAKLSEGNKRLDTGPVYIDPADEYQAYCLPKMSIVRDIFIFVREGFDAGTVATVTTIVDGTEIESTMDVATGGIFTLSTATKAGGALENGALFEVVDGFKVSFNQTSTEGVLQVIAGYTSLDEKSGKYVATV
ncbi:MAG: hypothetical protein DRP58_07665 [Spirochaetes bacterium]|nr:MAG: hypothetical protein DRP58_07665 [Spirochaetota bacterium]